MIVDILIIILIINNAVTLGLYLGSARLSDDNLKGWQDCSRRADDWKNKAFHFEKQWMEMIKSSNDNAEKSEKYLEKLKKYGLENL